MLRNIMLWWRAKSCYHQIQKSIHPRFRGMDECARCGTVFHSDGKPFGRNRESIIELDPTRGRVQSYTQPT
jgi:hypothetical protein